MAAAGACHSARGCQPFHSAPIPSSCVICLISEKTLTALLQEHYQAFFPQGALQTTYRCQNDSKTDSDTGNIKCSGNLVFSIIFAENILPDMVFSLCRDWDAGLPGWHRNVPPQLQPGLHYIKRSGQSCCYAAGKSPCSQLYHSALPALSSRCQQLFRRLIDWEVQNGPGDIHQEGCRI